MKHLKVWIFLLAGFLVLNAGRSFADPKLGDEAQFKKALAGVQTALSQNDAEKVAAWCTFPKFSWELPGLGDDLSREAFSKNFQKIFTPEIRQKLATGKFQQLQSSGDFTLEWNKKNDNYILIFEKQSDGSYKFGGLAVGPADTQG